MTTVASSVVESVGVVTDKLPEGWTLARAGDVLSLINGFPFKPSHWKGNGLPIIRIQNLNNPDAAFNYCPDHIPAKYVVKNGDLLFAWSGTPGTSFGAHVWSGGDAWLNQHIFRVEFDRELFDKQFLRLTINQNLGEYIEQAQGGVGLAHITKRKFEGSFLAVPPLSEQRRIAAKVERLQTHVKAARERLARVPTILKRFRQAILDAACFGRLTADLRAKFGRGTGCDEAELPLGWCRTAIQDLIPKGGLFDGPFGSSLKTADYADSGVRVIRLENIGQLRFNAEKETYISRRKYETLTKHTVNEGDIIFASFIDEEIRACVLPLLETKAIAKADCFCLRPSLETNRRYLAFQLVSRDSYDQLMQSVHGATRPRINTTQLRNDKQ